MLALVTQVKEINELRFVLCPKRMNDAQFWTVYFTLAQKYLPPEAFDPDYKLPEPQQDAHASLDLQGGIQRTLQTANSFAKEWGKRASRYAAGLSQHFLASCRYVAPDCMQLLYMLCNFVSSRAAWCQMCCVLQFHAAK